MNTHLRAIAEVNTRQWRNALEGIDESKLWQRPSRDANSLGFVAFHIVWMRYFFSKMTGLETENPFQSLNATNINELTREPSLAEMRAAWDAFAPEFHDYVALVDLEREATNRFPNKDETVGGLLLFSLHHEGYHIGQMGLLRKLQGVPAMKLF